MSGTINNWVAEGCTACGQSGPPSYQSPVALLPSTAVGSAPFDLTPSRLSVRLVRQTHDNNYAFKVGQPLTIKWVNAPLTYTWTFDEFHFHVPAEHTIVGQPVSVMEMHVKAKGTYTSGSGNGTANGVFAVQFAVNANRSTSPWLRGVRNAMAGASGQTFDITTALAPFQTQPVLFYAGSLTTPPCTGPVLFFVLQSPMPADLASWKDMASMLTALNGVSNVRPLKPYAGPTPTVLLPRR
jgi:carbonic anhydrase